MATGTIKRDVSSVLSTIKEIKRHPSSPDSIEVDFLSGKTVSFFVGKLDASHNYVQFFIDGVDKGYITFTVSRNVS